VMAAAREGRFDVAPDGSVTLAGVAIIVAGAVMTMRVALDAKRLSLPEQAPADLTQAA